MKSAAARMALAIAEAVKRADRRRRYALRGAPKARPRARKVTWWPSIERHELLLAEMHADGFTGSLTKYIEHRLAQSRRRRVS